MEQGYPEYPPDTRLTKPTFSKKAHPTISEGWQGPPVGAHAPQPRRSMVGRLGRLCVLCRVNRWSRGQRKQKLRHERGFP